MKEIRYISRLGLIVVACICTFSLYAAGDEADSCLMAQPLQQRYQGEYLDRFIKEIKGIEARSFVDLLAHWKDLSFTEEQQRCLLEKIDAAIEPVAMTYCLQRKAADSAALAQVYTLLSVSEVPVRVQTLYNLRFIGLWQKKDLEGLLLEMQKFADLFVEGGRAFDWVILGKTLDFVLEESNLSQTKEMLAILDKILAKSNPQYARPLKQSRDSFEGKVLMMEMGEE